MFTHDRLESRFQHHLHSIAVNDAFVEHGAVAIGLTAGHSAIVGFSLTFLKLSAPEEGPKNGNVAEYRVFGYGLPNTFGS